MDLFKINVTRKLDIWLVKVFLICHVFKDRHLFAYFLSAKKFAGHQFLFSLEDKIVLVRWVDSLLLCLIMTRHPKVHSWF